MLTFPCSSTTSKQQKLLPTPDSSNVQSASTSKPFASGMSTQASSSSSILASSKENVKEWEFHMPKKCTGTKKRTAAKKHNPMTNSVHPYQEVMSKKMYKLKTLCAQIGDLAACDLVLANRKSGVNNYHPNMDLADQMDMASKELLTLSKKLSTKADSIRENANSEIDKKHMKEGIVFMTQVTDPREKVELCNRRPHRMRYTQEMKPVIPPTLYVSDDEEMPMPTNNDPDTRFLNVKENQNNPDKIQFKCDSCGKVFRDSNELNNHISTHQYDLFRCMRCFKVCRSQFSFEKHMETHTGTEIRCKVCDKRFDLKTSLINHMQMHSDDKVRCETCGKTFQYHQNAIEHIRYAHHDTKTVPCPVCGKFYQTPTNMRSHRARRHGLVDDIVYHLNNLD